MDGARYLEDGRLTVFKRDGVFYARIRLSPGKYIWRSLKTIDEANALRAGRRLLFQMEHRADVGLPPKSKTFGTVIDEYVRFRERDHQHGKTSAGMLRQVIRVAKFWREYAGIKLMAIYSIFCCERPRKRIAIDLLKVALIWFGLNSSALADQFTASTLPSCSPTKDVSSWSDCQGSVKLPDGEQYVGEFRNGQYSGQGTLKTTSGNEYTGEFRDGKLNGRGTITYQSGGGRYVGNFVNGSSEGGTFYPSEGSKDSLAHKVSVVVLSILTAGLLFFVLSKLAAVKPMPIGRYSAPTSIRASISRETKHTILVATATASLVMAVGMCGLWFFGALPQRVVLHQTLATRNADIAPQTQEPNGRRPETQNELEFYFLGTERKVTDRNPYYGFVHYSTASRWQLTNISQRTVKIKGFKINRRTDCTLSVERTLEPGDTFVWFSSDDNCGVLNRIDVETDRTNEFWTMIK